MPFAIYNAEAMSAGTMCSLGNTMTLDSGVVLPTKLGVSELLCGSDSLSQTHIQTQPHLQLLLFGSQPFRLFRRFSCSAKSAGAGQLLNCSAALEPQLSHEGDASCRGNA